MKIITLDDIEMEWKPKSNNNKISILQKKVFDIVREILPTTPIIIEPTIPVYSRKTPLRIDLFVKKFNLAIEVDGQQHSKFTRFFHKNKEKFFLGQKRDNDKEAWLEKNNIGLLRLDHSESKLWRMKIEIALKR